MSYETVTLATKVFTRRIQKDDAVVLLSADHTIGVPINLELRRTMPSQSASIKVLRGQMKLTYSYRDDVTGKVYPVIFDVKSSIPVEVPPATVATALDQFQSAVASEALATDVLQNGIVY